MAIRRESISFRCLPIPSNILYRLCVQIVQAGVSTPEVSYRPHYDPRGSTRLSNFSLAMPDAK